MAEKPADNALAQVRQYWGIVYLHRWWILVSTVMITVIAVTAISLLRDYYQATTTILVDPQQVPQSYVASTVVEDPAQRLNTISQEVLSAPRLQQLIDQYNLYPELRKSHYREEIVDLMRKDISIQVKQGGGSSLSAFTITYKGTNPAVVAQVTNQLASGFIEWNLKDREEQVVGTTNFLKTELEKARTSLQDQESRLGHFKLEHAGEMPEDQAGNIQMLGQLQAELQSNRDALNRLDIQKTLLLHSPASAGEGNSSPAIQATERDRLLAEKRQVEQKLFDLRKKYTPQYPDIIALSDRLHEIEARVALLPPDPPNPHPEQQLSDQGSVQLSILEREAKRLTDEQKQIQEQMKVYRARVEAAPVRQQQVVDLSRNYQVSSNDYSSLLEKTTGSELAAELERRQKAERFTILDPAQVPEVPVKPKRKLLMVAAFLGALCFSVSTAVGKEVLSGKVLSEDELNKLLPPAVTVLSVIPVIETSAFLRRKRWLTCASVFIAALSITAEVFFLLKVKPIL